MWRVEIIEFHSDRHQSVKSEYYQAFFLTGPLTERY